MVSVLAFYSDDPSSNPAEVYNFSVKLLLKRMKINKKEAGVGPFFLKKRCFKYVPRASSEEFALNKFVNELIY